MRQQRRDLASSLQKQSARQVWRQIRRLPEFRRARRVAFYLPNDGELDLGMALQRALAHGKHCFLPVLTRNNALRFAPVTRHTRFVKNRFGIPEPAGGRRVSARKLDLVFIPLVAFDANANRIGMGGGFYDRSLTFKHHRRHLPPALFGAAHGFQKVDRIQANAWDVPLDGVVTPGKLMRFSANLKQ